LTQGGKHQEGGKRSVAEGGSIAPIRKRGKGVRKQATYRRRGTDQNSSDASKKSGKERKRLNREKKKNPSGANRPLWGAEGRRELITKTQWGKSVPWSEKCSGKEKERGRGVQKKKKAEPEQPHKKGKKGFEKAAGEWRCEGTLKKTKKCGRGRAGF